MTTEARWPVYSLKLKSRSEVAERTLEFRFDKPAWMTFKAGQFMDLTLIDPPETDAESNTRGFSINSAPDDPELMFTTRLRDTAFKRVLRTMPLGTEVKVEGPFGDLRLHNRGIHWLLKGLKMDARRGNVMPTRKAHARWEGSLKAGKGRVDSGNGAFAGAYSFASRFEEGFKITKSHLICEAKVPGIDKVTFVQHAEAAKGGCPVSQALAGVEITLDAKLAST